VTTDANHFHDVLAFHEKFGIGYDGPPRNLPGSIPVEAILHLKRFVHLCRLRGPENLRAFRAGFMGEEVLEWCEAEETGNVAAAFDALIDGVYVHHGTAVFAGFPFNLGWERVHAANMQKTRAPATGSAKRGSAHDVVKPAGWVAPTLDDLVR
jgi:predicted HAD superfamily Cof-like phosphohydrolase